MEVWTVTPADGAVSVDEFGVVTVAVDTTGLSDVSHIRYSSYLYHTFNTRSGRFLMHL